MKDKGNTFEGFELVERIDGLPKLGGVLIDCERETDIEFWF